MEIKDSILHKKTAQRPEKERCTVIGGAGGSRTHAPLTRPKAFRVNLVTTASIRLLIQFLSHRPAQRLEKCEISMQDNDERLGTRYPIKPAIMGFPADKVTCRMQTFESGITWICPYFSLFCFALHRLFSSFTLAFDTSNYIVLNVARGCLGNIWATLVFWATLFGAKQENSKNQMIN